MLQFYWKERLRDTLRTLYIIWNLLPRAYNGCQLPNFARKIFCGDLTLLKAFCETFILQKASIYSGTHAAPHFAWTPFWLRSYFAWGLIYLGASFCLTPHFAWGLIFLKAPFGLRPHFANDLVPSPILIGITIESPKGFHAEDPRLKTR